MKALKSYGLLVLILLGHLVSVWLYSNVLTKNSLQRRKAQLFASQQTTPSVWIFGDSHPMMALDPQYLPGSFNFASTSENYFLNCIKLKGFLKDGKKPEILVLPAELHSFSAQGQSLLLGHEMDDVFWSRQIGPSGIREENLPGTWLRWWISARFFPYAGQFYRFTGLWKSDTMQMSSQGFIGSGHRFSQNPDLETETRDRLKSHFGGYEILDSFQTHYLDKIAALCRKEQIQLVLVEFPVSRPYLEGSAGIPGIGTVDSVFNSLEKEIPVLKLRSRFENQPEYFSDPDHLNSKGAKILSQELNVLLAQLRRKPV
jgi:hypothetical protein